jgi:hypothetical protein
MKYTKNKGDGLIKYIYILPVFFIPVFALIFGLASPNCWADDGEFDETEIFFEFNSTDNDLGIQIFFDAEGWEDVEVEDPEGDTIFEVENDEGLKDIGSTEVFTESEEPELCPTGDCTEQQIQEAIEEFQANFLEGEYTFKGKTVEGDDLTGSAELAYDLPTAPVIIYPSDEGHLPVSGEAYTINWEQPVGGPGIMGYEVVAELVIEVGEDDERTLVNTGMLLAGATQFTVSPEFVQLIMDADDGSLKEFKVEVIARAVNLNKTITEFVVVSEDD